LSVRDLQLETMRHYKGLADQRADWAGCLVLLFGPGCTADGTPAAVSIASGTTLAVDADAAAMKAAMRSGYLDFVVNSLDEALRALKNEIRLCRALSVGLVGEVSAVLTEMVERGVQPDLNIAFPTHAARDEAVLAALKTFDDRALNSQQALEGSGRLWPQAWSFGNMFYFAAADAVALRGVDEALLAILSPDDLVRRRWIERVPRYLREARSGGRWIWLRDEEREAMERQGLSPVQQP
jgi:hypothetical protein